MSAVYQIDPDANLDFGVDWSPWLGTDTIVTSTWTVVGASKGIDTHDSTSTTVWISGAAAGATVTARNHITTTAGRADDRTLTIKAAQR